MSKELVDLTEQESKFIEFLFEFNGNISKAAQAANYHPQYGWKLRTRLAKAIIQASEQYLAINSMKAAVNLVDSIDKTMPNPVNVSAATAVLDRVGIIKKDPNEGQQVIKANIFILPEKRYNELEKDIIDITPNV